ncbi:MAG: hypothetical protein QOE70_4636 [Chthoniobacter sp.]|jgi:hypothetical protein|nr:hypothetical protein [Chthoniobacter sp.]
MRSHSDEVRRPHFTWLLLTFALVLGVLPAGALTVRVDPGGGAPRLVVDGKPVRARMFWGAPGAARVAATPGANLRTFEFMALAGASNGTMHFRFGQSAGDVWLDDLQVIDLDEQPDLIPTQTFEEGRASFAREWTIWPTDARNTVGTVAVEPAGGRDDSGCLHVGLVAPPRGPWPDFHVYHLPNLPFTEGHRYRVNLWMRAEPAREIDVSFQRPGTPFVRLGGAPDCFTEQIRLAADAGISFVSFPVGLPWPKPGDLPDWTSTDTACKLVLSANPQALLIPRIPMDPPPWWCAAHPDEVMQWEDGRRDHAVPASPLYRREASARLSALVEHLEDRFGDHIAGYHPVGQNTGEWFYEGTWKPEMSGYARADQIAWNAWLQKRYGTDEALRSAWPRADPQLGEVAVPAAAERHASPSGTFRDPAVEQPLIDFAEFQQEAMADCVIELAHAARTASRGRKLVVFFYGYLFEFCTAPNGPSVSGHYALRRVLESPEIDVLCSPISYSDRGLGESAPSMTAAESVSLAGKLWLNEDDTHTYLATGKPPGWLQHVATIEDTNRELTRNLAQEALRNFGTWWMDLGATGWFKDARMWAQMARLRALDEPLLEHPTPFHPEVAAVIDERSIWRVAPAGQQVTGPGIHAARASLGRLGTPYGQYLLDDVLAGKVKSKLYVFLNAWSLSAAEREKLLQVTRGSVRVWCYAPGAYDGDHLSTEAMQQLTGFALRSVEGKKASAALTDPGRKLGLTRGLDLERAIRPLFAATDAGANEVLATYADGSAAIALRRAVDGASLFIGPPGLTSELLRVAAREAHVHLFTEHDCNVCANGPFLAIHAAQEGPIELDTGKPGEVIDVLTGQIIGNGPRVSLPARRGDTWVLRY